MDDYNGLLLKNKPKSGSENSAHQYSQDDCNVNRLRHRSWKVHSISTIQGQSIRIEIR
ncbi:unnamed protein product [Nesidiocoris tenuis]|uniref:Uncharacterized protein n=1 Tax=Nesidiocoris tenuis TaxID=355587 RepID=A0A6H5H0Q7_9HEMI|nr:unnamed protein product [Nesidiocoris tenuis]